MKAFLLVLAVFTLIAMTTRTAFAQNWPAPGPGCGYAPQQQICAVQYELQKPEVKAFLYAASIPGNTVVDAQWHAQGVALTYGVYGHSNN